MVRHNIEQIPKQQCQLFLVQTTLFRAAAYYELYNFYKYSCRIFYFKRDELHTILYIVKFTRV